MTINEPEGLYLYGELECGQDVEIRPPVYISGKVIIGPNAVVGPFAYLEDCEVGPGEHSFLKKVKENIDSIIC